MHADELQHMNARLTLLEDMLVTVVNLSKPEIQLTTRDLLQRRQAEAAQDKRDTQAYIAQLLGKLDLPAPINNS